MHEPQTARGAGFNRRDAMNVETSFSLSSLRPSQCKSSEPRILGDLSCANAASELFPLRKNALSAASRCGKALRLPQHANRIGSRLAALNRSSVVPLSTALAACCLLLPNRAAGQDALFSNLALDRTLSNAQPGPAAAVIPDAHHLGPVAFAAVPYTGVQFNDNINLAPQDTQSDAIIRVGVTLDVNWPATPQSALNLDASIGYRHYLEHSQYDGLEVAPNSALSYSITWDQGSLAFYDQFSYLQDVISQPALSGVATFPRLENTVGTRLTFEPGKWELTAGYSHYNYFSGSSTYEYLNRASEYFFSRAGWRFSQKTEAGVEASATLTSYAQAIQSDYDSISIGGFVDWQVTQAINASIHGGPTYYTFYPTDGRPNSTLNAYYFSLELEHRITEFLSHRASVRHDISPGLNLGSDYVEATTVSYTLSCALTRRLNTSLSFNYQQGIQPFQIFIFEFKENYEQYGISPNLSWQLTDRLAATLNYAYWNRTSDLPGRNYTQNTVDLRLSYNF
jgi:hypothetical protein